MVQIRKNLDIVSAGAVFDYVSDVIDRCPGPVLDLSAVDYCDARGLRALARLCHYAGQSCCRFQLAAPSNRLIKSARIAAVDLKFTEF